MTTVELASISLVFITYLAFAGKRGLTYMHVLQQEEYDNSRLLSWMGKHKVFDKRLSLALVFIGIAWFFLPPFFSNFLVFIGLVITTYLEKDPRKNSKKKLVATSRAKRIFFPAYALSAFMGVICFYNAHPWIWIPVIQLIPFTLILVNMILQPFEDIIQQSYWNEARSKMKQLSPTIIGVTGSFGKTSVKHMLGHILKTQAPTLVTPGSINTPMGITRVIREELDENHKYFVVEMGAYGKGSIERLCKLTPPDIGVITAVGHAHYERFKSLDTVSETKFEMADAALKKESGKVIIHERTLRFPYPRKCKGENIARFVVCGEPPEADVHKRIDVSYLQPEDLHITRVEQYPEGLEVSIKWKGEDYVLTMPLYGLHHGHNAALTFATAVELGIPAEDIVTAFKSMPQIEHRLELKKQPDKSVIIDDAYNSNPVGFRSALDLLTLIKKDNGRNILITPGIVELGVAHDEAHEKLGQYAGQVCDIALIVSPKRIPTFIKGFKSTGGSKQLMEMETFQEASRWVEKNRQPGDIILIENDLPDMYERIPRI